ncbi:hypothetical protein ABZY34_04810 [Streptomyces virginiae]|uniref:hypothetical protein n=1 Tax=Streptomyces virginiae TaxID=1961 RepID=UPI0033B6F56B
MKALAESMVRDGSVQIGVHVTVTSRRAALDHTRAVADAQRLQYERTAPPFQPDSAGTGRSLAI